MSYVDIDRVQVSVPVTTGSILFLDFKVHSRETSVKTVFGCTQLKRQSKCHYRRYYVTCPVVAWARGYPHVPLS